MVIIIRVEEEEEDDDDDDDCDEEDDDAICRFCDWDGGSSNGVIVFFPNFG
jgi:hypothetical protein